MKKKKTLLKLNFNLSFGEDPKWVFHFCALSAIALFLLQFLLSCLGNYACMYVCFSHSVYDNLGRKALLALPQRMLMLRYSWTSIFLNWKMRSLVIEMLEVFCVVALLGFVCGLFFCLGGFIFWDVGLVGWLVFSPFPPLFFFLFLPSPQLSPPLPCPYFFPAQQYHLLKVRLN